MEKTVGITKDMNRSDLLESLKEKKQDLSSMFTKSTVREGKESTFYDTTLREVWGDPLN